MYIPNPYFKNIPQIGDLVLDHIFVENGYPILFTCYSEEKIYLCLCRTIYEEQKWIIAEINENLLESIINNKISIFEAFKSTVGKICIARWSKENPYEKYEVVHSSQLKDDDLPDKEIYLDDEGYSTEYLELVKNRMQNMKEKSSTLIPIETTPSLLTSISLDYNSLENLEYIDINDIEYTSNSKYDFVEDTSSIITIRRNGGLVENSVINRNNKQIVFAA